MPLHAVLRNRNPGLRIRIGSGFNRVSGSGFGIRIRRAKMTHKSRNFSLKFMFWSVGWPLLRAEDFFCNLDVLYGGLGIGKLQFLIKIKNKKNFSAVIFLKFLVINALDPDWYVFSLKCWIRIRMKWMRIRNPAETVGTATFCLQRTETGIGINYGSGTGAGPGTCQKSEPEPEP